MQCECIEPVHYDIRRRVARSGTGDIRFYSHAYSLKTYCKKRASQRRFMKNTGAEHIKSPLGGRQGGKCKASGVWVGGLGMSVILTPENI